MKKYGSTIWLLVILAFLPLEWYKSAVPYLDENFVQKFYSVNDLRMFIYTLSRGAWRSASMRSIWHTGCPNGYNFFEILTIYLLCLAIQYLVIKNQRGYLIAAISKILLIGQIAFAPISAIYPASYPSSASTFKILFQRANIYIFPIYKLGFFLAILCILISIIWDIVSWIQSKKNSEKSFSL